MKAAVGVGVRAELAAFGINLAGILQIGLQGLAVVVRVDEVVAGVVGRIDIDHLDLAQVGLLQELQDLKVVALDDEVLRRVEVDALLRTGAKRPEARHLDRLETIGLARPVHPIAFLAHVHCLAQSKFQPFNINFSTFCPDFRKEPQQLLPFVFSHVMRPQVKFFGFHRLIVLAEIVVHGSSISPLSPSHVI